MPRNTKKQNQKKKGPLLRRGEMDHVLIFLLMSHLLIFLSNPFTISAAESTNKSDIELRALLDFKLAITNDTYGVFCSWNVSVHFCRWSGVMCGKAHPSRVVSLALNSQQLVGQLSSSLGNLTSLRQLDLGNNSFHGPIPEELGTLPKLQYLFLAYNSLSGGIPHSLATSSSLIELSLANNMLEGTIPGSLGNTSRSLSYVDLAYNRLSGDIPPHSLATSSSLIELNLANNMLEGKIPRSLGTTSRSLSYVYLAYNNLTGGIPHSLATNSSLTVLDLAMNGLSGMIPANLFNGSSQLISVYLGWNLFSGPIPDGFHGMVTLQFLSLSGNNLSGSIPASLGNISSLTRINLGLNNLGGSIPETLSQIQNLSVLGLSENNLLGHVPAQIYNISSLVRLALSHNKLTGTIPSGNEFSLPNLVLLTLSSNTIEGSIPASLANSSKLQMISLSRNSISGEIPSSIWNLRNLVFLSLSRNKLSGQISPAVGNLSQLSQLSLDSNSLSGNIPASLGQCKRLTGLNLSVNNLAGNIPTQLLTIATLLSLDLSKNNLIGSIPEQIGLINLAVLNISYNQLSGQIPRSLGQCPVLSFLHVENNQLDGEIPQSFMNLKAIQQIDLSHNNLTGQIPDFFNSFTALEELNLSFNKFEGPVPTSGYFLNGSAVDLYGNTKLCASFSMFALPICPTTSTVLKSKNTTRLLLIVALPVTIAFFSLLTCICMVTLLKKRTYTEPVYKETMKKVSYGDILKATNWLSPVNKISSSRTGSVYIGRFEFDTDLVAIKVFHLEEHGSLNSFLMECEVLRNTRHRNLMKPVTLCSTADLENNEFKAIVFDFMANGSLDMWVHPKLYQSSPKRGLSLGQRIRIAMDVASALDYMHNQLTSPLVHCDLKPANVLLDYDMTARVGDFGSSKFLSSGIGGSEGFVAVGGTIGYIAPEYGMGYKISTGCDVYSFGVLLLEMLTGKRPTDTMFIDGMSLHKLVSSAYPNGLHEVLDPYMSQEGDRAFASSTLKGYLIPLVEIGLLCSMELPKDRPVMQDICARIFEISEAFLESW
ncbi:unnamed protein product [Urochloa decumbens]|uniref:non-specific serine/threonine protein kinase n=1 Tax=Urochloa decumbens TaxID=240449 RepID=A0ABC9BXS8_9POAL